MDKEHGEECECGCHKGMCGMRGHHHWGHIIVKLFIVLFIFWAGMQFGELKATVDNITGGMGNHHAYYSNYPMQEGMTGDSGGAPTGVSVQMMRVATGTRQ